MTLTAQAEKGRLRKGVAVVVGTPGRVADHVDATKAWCLDRCRLLVLDEADRLLELGFKQTLEKARNGCCCGGAAGSASQQR